MGVCSTTCEGNAWLAGISVVVGSHDVEKCRLWSQGQENGLT